MLPSIVSLITGLLFSLLIPSAHAQVEINGGRGSLSVTPSTASSFANVTMQVVGCSSNNNVEFRWTKYNEDGTLKSGYDFNNANIKYSTNRNQNVATYVKNNFSTGKYSVYAVCDKSKERDKNSQSADKSIISNVVALNVNQPTPNLQVSPNPSMTNQTITMSIKGCTGSSKATFRWVRTGSGNGPDSEEVDLTNGAGDFTKGNFSLGTYDVSATCSNNDGESESNHVSLVIDEEGEDNENFSVPEKITENTEWTMTFNNLTERFEGTFWDQTSCYALLIQKDDEYFGSQDFGGSYGVNCKGTVQSGDKDTNHEPGSTQPYFSASSDWNEDKQLDMPGMEAGSYTISLYRVYGTKFFSDSNQNDNDKEVYSATVNICAPNDDSSSCLNTGGTEVVAKTAPSPVCATFSETGECIAVNTALGEALQIDLPTITKTIFTLLLSISGGIILLIVIRSGYILMISQGNAEKIKEAQDRLTSAVVGLLFLIFSLVVLEVIGVDILKIPGFGS